MAKHPNLETRSQADGKIKKMLRDHRVLIARCQAWQEKAKEIIDDAGTPPEQVTELSALIAEFDDRVKKKTRDDNPQRLETISRA